MPKKSNFELNFSSLSVTFNFGINLALVVFLLVSTDFQCRKWRFAHHDGRVRRIKN